jgi:hypothetical protein
MSFCKNCGKEIIHNSSTIELQNIPLKYVNGFYDYPDFKAIDVKQYIVTQKKNWMSSNKGSAFYTATYLSPVWTKEASLQVVFREKMNP